MGFFIVLGVVFVFSFTIWKMCVPFLLDSFGNLPLFLLLPHVVKVPFKGPGLKTSAMNDKWGLPCSQASLALFEPALPEGVWCHSLLLDREVHLLHSASTDTTWVEAPYYPCLSEEIKVPARALLRSTGRTRALYIHQSMEFDMLFTTKCTGKSQASFSHLRQHSSRAVLKPSCSLVTVNSRCPHWIVLLSSWMVSNPEFLISLCGKRTVISCLVIILSLGSRGKAFSSCSICSHQSLGFPVSPALSVCIGQQGSLRNPAIPLLSFPGSQGL